MEQFKIKAAGKLRMDENLIGAGSFSNVYLYKSDNGKNAAIKIFKQQVSTRKMEKLVTRLLSISHENVVAFVGFSLKPAAVSFEYCEVCIGQDEVHTMKELIEIFQDENYVRFFGFDKRLSYCHQAIEGLIHLHKNDIIHQDVKPSNMLVSGPPNSIIVKLCDYGEMSVFKETYLTNTRIEKDYRYMTITYIAPEICLNLVEKPTTKTDAYALGISAYEIFSGLENAWEKTLAKLDETLIKSAIREWKLPNTRYLYKTYGEEEVEFINEILQKLWTDKILDEVTHFFFKFLFLFTILNYFIVFVFPKAFSKCLRYAMVSHLDMRLILTK